MRLALAAAMLLCAVPAAFAADAEAGRKLAETACAACHGANGVSVNAEWPNLAAQHGKYLTAQLKAFKDGKRRNELMNAIAVQLSDADIDNVVAYYGGLPGAGSNAVSKPLPNLVATGVTFPKDFKSSFKAYTTIDMADRKQVRVYWANPVALTAAAEGKALPNDSYLLVEVFSAKLDDAKALVKGADGKLVADKVLFHTAMAMGQDWGKNIPDLLRNGDWNYAVYNADGTNRGGNQAACLACHKPLPKDSYLFTWDKLQAFAKAK